MTLVCEAYAIVLPCCPNSDRCPTLPCCLLAPENRTFLCEFSYFLNLVLAKRWLFFGNVDLYANCYLNLYLITVSIVDNVVQRLACVPLYLNVCREATHDHMSSMLPCCCDIFFNIIIVGGQVV